MTTTHYRLSESDFIALNRYVLLRHRRAVVMNIVSTGAAVGLVAFVLLRSETHDTGASLIAGAVVGLVTSCLYALYIRSQIRTDVSKHLAADSNALGDREITVTPEGIRERTQSNDCFHAWSGLDSVGITRTHVFMHLDRFTAYIVPRAMLSPDAIELILSSVPDAKRWSHGAQPGAAPDGRRAGRE